MKSDKTRQAGTSLSPWLNPEMRTIILSGTNACLLTCFYFVEVGCWLLQDQKRKELVEMHVEKNNINMEKKGGVMEVLHGHFHFEDPHGGFDSNHCQLQCSHHFYGSATPFLTN